MGHFGTAIGGVGQDFVEKCGLLHTAKSIQSELLVGGTSVLLTDPTRNYKEGMNTM